MKDESGSATNRLWRRILEVFPSPALLVTPGATVVASNSALAELIGIDGAALNGISVSSLVNDPPGEMLHYVHLCAGSPRPVPGRLSWRLQSGKALDCRCDGALLPSLEALDNDAPGEMFPPRAAGDTQSLILIACRPSNEATPQAGSRSDKIDELWREVAEHKLIEEQLRQDLKDRDEFLSVASHELRNPLNALQLTVYGLVRILGGEGARITSEQLLHRVNRIGTQITRLTKLVDNLLDVSRLASGRFEVEREHFDLTMLVTEAIERARESDASAPIMLTAPHPLPIVSSRTRLDQVVSNLLSNALKYGQGKPVEVIVQAQGDRITIDVTDHGIGISAQDLGRIFERFERAVGEGTSLGFGLGLWIARGVVEHLDGRIRAQSEPGLGSTFTIELPRGELN